jgi:hypothetical protein
VIALAAVVAHNLALTEGYKRVVRIVLERNLEEVAVPIVVDKEAVEPVHMAVVHREFVVAVPIAVRMEIEDVQVAHREVVVAVPNLVVGLDHKTWIIPPVGYAQFQIALCEVMCSTILQACKQTVKFESLNSGRSFIVFNALVILWLSFYVCRCYNTG